MEKVNPAEQCVSFDQHLSNNGARIVDGFEADGTKHSNIGAEKVMNAYGYTKADYQGKSPAGGPPLDETIVLDPANNAWKYPLDDVWNTLGEIQATAEVDGEGIQAKAQVILKGRGYNSAGDAADEATAEPVDWTEVVNGWGVLQEGFKDASYTVSGKRLLHAIAAAKDYKHGHERLDNPHIADLSGEEKLLLGTSSPNERKYYKKMVGKDVFKTEMTRITDVVKGGIDQEIKDRLDNIDPYEFWAHPGKKNPWTGKVVDPKGGAGGGEGGGDGKNENDDLDIDPVALENLNNLYNTLVQSRSAYAEESGAYTELSAKRRRTTFGVRRKLNAAREAYEQSRNRAGAAALHVLQAEGGFSATEISILAAESAVMEAACLEQQIYENHMENHANKRKPVQAFYNLWARLNGRILERDEEGNRHFNGTGLRNRVAKGAMLGAVGIIPGVIAGAAGTLILGPVGGAAAGAFVGTRVARSLVGTHVSQEAEALTVGGEQYNSRIPYAVDENNQAVLLPTGVRQLRTDHHLVAQILSGEGGLRTEDVTAAIDNDTARDRKRNRIRAGVGAAASLASGLLTAWVIDNIAHPAAPNKPQNEVEGKWIDDGGAKPGNTPNQGPTWPTDPEVVGKGGAPTQEQINAWAQAVRFNQETLAVQKGIDPSQYPGKSLDALVPVQDNPEFWGYRLQGILPPKLVDDGFMPDQIAKAWAHDPSNPDYTLAA